MDGAQTDKATSSPVEVQAEISGLLARGAVAEAQRLLETALASWPKNPKLRLLEGEVLAAASPARAAAHYATLIADPALAPWALARLADLFPISELAGEDAAAIAEAVCSDAVERKFKEPILDALLATDDAETKARLTEIAGTRSAIFKYESRLAVARTEAGDFAGATAVLKKARDEGRLSIHAAVLYADLLAVSGELGASIALLEELLAAHPEHTDVSRRLTMMLQRARDFDRAAEVFEQAVARWPQDWMLVYRLNRLPVPRERYERILDLLFARAGDALENNERFRFQAALAALHADDPARGFALLDRRFTPPVSILAVPVQKALKARAQKGWREGSRLVDDRTKEVQVTRTAGARATVVLTTGITFGNLPLAFVDTLFAAHGINVIYLRDFAKRAYLRGVSALGASEEETVATLKRMAAELEAKRLIAMGSSSGGFSALRVGRADGRGRRGFVLRPHRDRDLSRPDAGVRLESEFLRQGDHGTRRRSAFRSRAVALAPVEHEVRAVLWRGFARRYPPGAPSRRPSRRDAAARPRRQRSFCRRSHDRRRQLRSPAQGAGGVEQVTVNSIHRRHPEVPAEGGPRRMTSLRCVLRGTASRCTSA